MEISFYEEFPTKNNLNKLKLIKFKSTLFIAAKSLEEFKKIEITAKNINKKITCAYWPIIKNSYWISPFSNTKDLQELFNELESFKGKILIDLEFPIKRLMILRNLFLFVKNKRIIKKFIIINRNRIVTAQFPITFLSKLMRFLGLDYNINNEKSLMWYSSMVPNWLNNFIKKNLLKIKNKEDYSISLGTIAIGILGNEPILSPEHLAEDITFIKKAGFRKIIIFRLGGLNKKYIDILEKIIHSS